MAKNAEDRRLERATELINTSNKTISQISQETGFGGVGETLCAKLVERGYATEEDLKSHRKATHKRNEGGSDDTTE